MAALKYIIVAILTATGLCACEGQVTAANFERVQTGMSREEVVHILGEPDETTGVAIANFSGQAATWTDGKDRITVQFVNNKVFGKQATIGSTQK